ncbi:MAG: penicillin-binding protein activator [Pseudomonadota bacterium]
MLKRALCNRVFIVFFSIILVACGADNNRRAPNVFTEKPALTPQKQVPISKIKPIKKSYNVALVLPTKYNDPNNRVRTNAILNAARNMVNAADMARRELREQKLKFAVYETDGTAETLVPAIKQAITNNVDIILGPLRSEAVQIAKGMTEQAGIPMIAFSSDSMAVNNAKMTFLLSYLIEQNISEIVAYAASEGHMRFGFYGGDTQYTRRANKIFAEEVKANRGYITNSVIVNANAPDYFIKTKEFTERATSDGDVGETSYSAFLLTDNARSLMQIIPRLDKLGMSFDKQLVMGTSIWQDENILMIKELNRAVFAAPDFNRVKIFEERYMAKYGGKPLPIASLAYDAVAMIVALVRNHKTDPFNIRYITTPNGFNGVGGIFRFRKNGLSERGLAIVQINDGAFEIIEPAPKSFYK